MNDEQYVGTFEQAMQRLQEITRLLDDPELPLDQAVANYEEGMRLAAFCHQQLSGFETKVNSIREQYDESVTKEATDDI